MITLEQPQCECVRKETSENWKAKYQTPKENMFVIKQCGLWLGTVQLQSHHKSLRALIKIKHERKALSLIKLLMPLFSSIVGIGKVFKSIRGRF